MTTWYANISPEERQAQRINEADNAWEEDFLEPGWYERDRYNLPGYSGIVLQSDPPQIRLESGANVPLIQDASGAWTYPPERPGYDPASGMIVPQYNELYDQRFPYGDPGMVIPNVWGKARDYTFDVDGNTEAYSLPDNYDNQWQAAQAMRAREGITANPNIEVVSRPDTTGGLIQVGPLGMGNAQPSTARNAIKSYYDESKSYFNPEANKLNIVF